MRRLIGGWMLTFMLASGWAHAGFNEGQQYMAVPFPATVETGNKIEVREFFWYGCPHCYVLEPALLRWLKKLPANAEFVRTPGTASPSWAIHAQAFYAFEALGVAAKLHESFFKAVQEQHNVYSDEKGITEFAASHGIDRKKFSEAFNSFGVRLKFEKAKQLNEALNINSVPTFVVDGKYLTSPAMTEGEERFFQVVDYLINKAAKERKKKPARP